MCDWEIAGLNTHEQGTAIAVTSLLLSTAGNWLALTMYDGGAGSDHLSLSCVLRCLLLMVPVSSVDLSRVHLPYYGQQLVNSLALHTVGE